MDIDRVVEAYLNAVEFTETSETLYPEDWDDEMRDAHPILGFSDSMTEEARRDCEDFLDGIASSTIDLGDMTSEVLGIDFWLTRNRHGAGFWDRGLGKLGEDLTEMCRPYGEVGVYLGDDGFIYFQ